MSTTRPFPDVDARRHWDADAAFFAARRAESVTFEIGGADVADVALEYAEALGFLDRAFHENLIDHGPSEELKLFCLVSRICG